MDGFREPVWLDVEQFGEALGKCQLASGCVERRNDASLVHLADVFARARLWTTVHTKFLVSGKHQWRNTDNPSFRQWDRRKRKRRAQRGHAHGFALHTGGAEFSTRVSAGDAATVAERGPAEQSYRPDGPLWSSPSLV